MVISASRLVTGCRYEEKAWDDRSPENRFGHVAVIVGDRMLVYGGKGGDPLKLWTYNIATKSWTSTRTHGPIPECAIYSRAFVYDHRCLYQYMYFIGGRDIRFKCSNSVHRLNLTSMIWSKCPTGGAAMSPRSGFVCWQIEDACTMFGGLGPSFNTEPHELYHELYHEDGWMDGWNDQVYELSLGDQPTWTKPRTTGPTPAPRSGSAQALINGVCYMVGGM